MSILYVKKESLSYIKDNESQTGFFRARLSERNAGVSIRKCHSIDGEKASRQVLIRRYLLNLQ